MRECPFCGYDEGWIQETSAGKFRVQCKVCSSSGPESSAREGAEAKWNGILADLDGEEFEDMLQEEMGGASSPASNLVNTPGMGNVVPPTADSLGSGDKWGSEEEKPKKKKKKKNKKVTEHKIETLEDYAKKNNF